MKNNKILLMGIFYLLFSIFFTILNFFIADIALYHKEHLNYALLNWIIYLTTLSGLPFNDYFTHYNYEILLLVSRGFLICLGISFYFEKNSGQNKRQFIFKLILPLAIISFILYLPIIRAIWAFINLLFYKIEFVNYYNVDLFIVGEQLTTNLIIILLGIYLIYKKEKYLQLKFKFLSGKINVILGIIGIAITLFIPFFSFSNIYINSYYFIASFNVIVGGINIPLSYIFFKAYQMEKEGREYQKNRIETN